MGSSKQENNNFKISFKERESKHFGKTGRCREGKEVRYGVVGLQRTKEEIKGKTGQAKTWDERL